MANVVLRDVLESDLPIFFEQQNDPEANHMAAFPARQREPFMAHWKKNMGNKANIHRTILADRAIVGNIVSFEMDGHREVGYWLGRDFWGKGIASAALAQFLTIEQRRPLYAHVVKHNVGSYRVLEKCGFVLYSEDNNEFIGEPIEEFVLKLD